MSKNYLKGGSALRFAPHRSCPRSAQESLLHLEPLPHLSRGTLEAVSGRAIRQVNILGHV